MSKWTKDKNWKVKETSGVYVIYAKTRSLSAKKIIYIGSSKNIFFRLFGANGHFDNPITHKKTNCGYIRTDYNFGSIKTKTNSVDLYAKIRETDTYREALKLERNLILRLKPYHNKQHNSDWKMTWVYTGKDTDVVS